MRLAPYRDLGLMPNPSASNQDIAALERRLAAPLPLAYREFLAYSNGWVRFFDGAHLLGTQDLGAPALIDAAQSLLRRALPSGAYEERKLLPFATDPQNTTLFAFDYTRPDKEPSVVAWVQEIGVSAAGFAEFLDFLLTLSAAELGEQRAAARRAASKGRVRVVSAA